ncbi:unnamed protein product [Cylindrotheca closterium]|uniref:Uncharacterized protein n=1 Tax=Cylindrotheca closterium TaxID=2856 RepID=A0AAD2CRH6_9STRA|nr:unnamed protein product [Cylindrotheca closterium]
MSSSGSSSQPIAASNRQGSIAARYLNTKTFRTDNAMRYAGSHPQKVASTKSLNESTFTASTVMLDSSMGSSSNEGSSTTSRSQMVASPDSKNTSLDRSMDFSMPLTPGRESTATSSVANSESSRGRRSLINRFRKRRQQNTFAKLGLEHESSGLEKSPSRPFSQQQQFAPTSVSYQPQQAPTLNRAALDQRDSTARETNALNSSTAPRNDLMEKNNARKILSSRIALRARSKGIFPKTTPPQPRHPQPQSMPLHPQQHREETETAPTEIMAPTEVMQNLSSARGMEPRNSAALSEAGAPTEIMNNQSRKAPNHRFRTDPALNFPRKPLSLPTPQHALLDDATITSDQQSLPIQSLIDLQQSSSISTTNSLEKQALHTEATMQSPPRAWKNGPKRSLDSLFAKQQRSLQNNKSDDASSCFTEERELDHDAVVQRVFSLDKVDLEQAVPLPLPSLLTTNPNTKQACAQVQPRHPTEVSLTYKEQQQQQASLILNEIPEATPSQEKDEPMEEGLSFASKEVHAPSLRSDEGMSFGSREGIQTDAVSVSKSVSLDGLAFAKSNEDGVFEDSAESLFGNLEESIISPAGSVQGNDNDFGLYDDLDQLQNSPTGSTSFMSMEANPPSIGSMNDTDLPESQREAVSTPHTRLTSIITPDNVSNDDHSNLEKEGRNKEGEWTDLIEVYRSRSSVSDSKNAVAVTVEPKGSDGELIPTTNVASSRWTKTDDANKFAERRSYGSIKDRIKAFDKPQKVWKPPVKGKTWKSPSKVANGPAPRQEPTLPAVVVDVGLESNYSNEEKKSEEAPFSFIRDDDDADTVSVKSMKDIWENRISGTGNFASQSEKDDFDIDNDTIRDDDDDCASVKSLKDAWEIKFSQDDLDNGFDDDLDEDAGTVKSRREELQKRISDQQGIPRVVSVDEDENDNLDLDDGNESVKSLRKRFDAPNGPKRESVNRLRAMFEQSGASSKSSPARSKSWRANKSPARNAPARNRSFNSQGSAPRSSGNVSHGGDEDSLRRMAMAWSQKRSEAKRKSVPSTPTESDAQEVPTLALDTARMEINEAADDGFASGARGKQSEALKSTESTNAGMHKKPNAPALHINYRERSMTSASKSTARPMQRQGSGDGRSAPSMQDRLDRWSNRLKAAKKKPVYVQNSPSMEFSVSEASMKAASSFDNIGQESVGQPSHEEERLQRQMSMPRGGDARGRSMDTEYSDAVTLDVSIAEVSNITDPSGLRTMRSQDTLSDVLSSPGRTQFVTSPGRTQFVNSPSRMTVELNQVIEEPTPEESILDGMPQLSGTGHAIESNPSSRMEEDIRKSHDYGDTNPFSLVSAKTHEPVESEQDPFCSLQNQFVVDEKQSRHPDTSMQDRSNPARLEEIIASSASFAPAHVSSGPTKKPNAKLRMIPVLRRPTSSSNSTASEQPVPEHPVPHMQSPKKQRKKVSFKLSDSPSINSADSRVTEKTASSSELSSLPPIPSQYDDDYEAVMQERHRLLLQRQRALKERVTARQDASPQVEPIVNHQRTQGSRQSRTQMRLFGRTHPIHRSTQKSNATMPKTNKAASRSLFSKNKAQQHGMTEAPIITPTKFASPESSPAARPLSNATPRSLLSKMQQVQTPPQTPVTPPRNSEPMEETNPGYGYSPMRTGSPIKAVIPRYHPRSQVGRKQQATIASKKQSTSLFNSMASTLGFGHATDSGATDIVARLKSYQSTYQPRTTTSPQQVAQQQPPAPVEQQQPAQVETDDFADFADFASFNNGLEADEWL